MAHVGTKFYLILPPESKGIKLTCLCNQRVKLSCFSQKTAILSEIWGCFPPPRAPNTWPGWPLWAPNFPLYSPLSQRESNRLGCAIKESNYHVLAKKQSFCVKFGGVFRPPRAPNPWPGWPLWAPNFTLYSPLSQRESNRLACAIKESNYHVSAKKRPFWVKFGGVFRPPRAPNTWPGWPLWAPNFP